MFRFVSMMVLLALFVPVLSYAAPKLRQYESNAVDVSVAIPGTEGMTEMEVITILKHDIDVLDEELRQCERKRKGWVAATVVGGVGVVGTGIAAIVQGNKIKEQKSELKRVESDVQQAKESADRGQQRLDNM